MEADKGRLTQVISNLLDNSFKFTSIITAQERIKTTLTAISCAMEGIIFGVAFLSVAKTLKKDSELRNYMIIAAWGFTLFYIAGSATASQAAYPPYGLRIIVLSNIFRALFFSGYGISGYCSTQLYQKICK